MKSNMAQRHKSNIPTTSEPGFGRMLTFSVLLHVLILVFASGALFNQKREPERLSYKVNLANKPVAQPRQGRPDVQKQVEKPAPKQPAPKPAPKPEPKPTPTPKPTPKPEPKPEAVKKVTLPAAEPKKVKPEPKKATPAPAPQPPPAPAPVVQPKQPMLSTAEIENLYQQDTQERIDAMRQERTSRTRIEQLKQQLAADTQTQSPTTVVATGQVGSIGGTGTQAGVDFTERIKGYLMENWTLPLTHWKKELYSVVELRFDPQGRRRGFRVIRASGDSLFDQSVEKAVTKLDKLPNPPGKELSLSVKFDPKEKY